MIYFSTLHIACISLNFNICILNWYHSVDTGMIYFFSLHILDASRDLNHSNQYIMGLALCALGNICSAEMARDLAPEVERLLQIRDPNIKKKVQLFSVKMYVSTL